MTEEASELRAAFGAAYEPHVRQRIAMLGAAVDSSIELAIAEGRAWLDTALEELSRIAFGQQRRGPLELFQEAMRFPTKALAVTGLSPIARDEVVANALPGDHFGLAPASSHELGETAWNAHLEWSAAKIIGMRVLKRIGVLSRNLMDRSKLDSALSQGGFESIAVRDSLPESLWLMLIDLEHPSSHDIARACVDAGVTCIAYGPHVDTEAMAAIDKLGIDRVIPRSQVLRDPARFVATL